MEAIPQCSRRLCHACWVLQHDHIRPLSLLVAGFGRVLRAEAA